MLPATQYFHSRFSSIAQSSLCVKVDLVAAPRYTERTRLGKQIFAGVDTMASSQDYLQFILEQLSELDDISYRAMMGEFILYYRGKVIGGIYDDRLLVKAVPSAVAYMQNPTYELPYGGAKEMLLVSDVDDKEYLAGLFRSMYDDLPAPKTKKRS